MRRVLALLSACVAASVLATPAAAVPAGFTDSIVATVGAPTALAFTPDGRLLVATQGGQLRIVQNGALLATPALSLGSSVCTQSERGLLGIAVDPAFALNHAIYLYYTHNASPCVNRVSRFTLSDANVVDRASELVLLDRIHSTAGNHNGGDLHFGKDGHLYVSVGDGGCDYASPSSCAGANDAARDRHVLLGKILRITPSGGIPGDNPFQGPGTGRCNLTGATTAGDWCQETYAWGLRNPFRFAFDPNASGTKFFVNDVGQGTWEEIDLGLAGADYGWNVREGACPRGSTTGCGAPPAGMTNPIHSYPHTSGCRSITGGAFVPNGIWPAEHDGDYLFGDYVCGKIFRLESTASGFTSSEFESGLGGSSAVALAFGPHGPTQALYYTTYRDSGQVRRVAYASGPPPEPPIPQPPPATGTNTAPTVTITAPAQGTRARAGETVTFAATASDAEDGALAPARISWRVLRHHGTSHTHPWVAPTTGATADVTMPEPEDLATAATSFLEVIVTATDSGGLTTTATRELRPRVATLSLATRPTGLRLSVEGEAVTAPSAPTWAEGGDLLVEAPPQIDARGVPWRFAAWSDGGARRRVVGVPGSLRARFVAAVRITALHARGEWIRIRNTGGVAVRLRGWTLADRSGVAFRFGRVSLSPGRAIAVFTGSTRYGTWRRARNVWNDRNDRAVLRTKSGAFVSACAYGARPRTTVGC